jgi:hypothetical protein
MRATCHDAGIADLNTCPPPGITENSDDNDLFGCYQQHGDWWIGWIEQVPGVNSQGVTREELLDNLRDTLEEALEMNRADARAAATGTYEEVSMHA